MNGFTRVAIQTGLDLLLQILKNKENSRVRAFLLDQKTQNTVQEIYSQYAAIVAELDTKTA
jgi:hypothetical protein